LCRYLVGFKVGLAESFMKREDICTKPHIFNLALENAKCDFNHILAN
jgi:hypothetical protein